MFSGRGAGAVGLVGLLFVGCGSSSNKTDGGSSGSACADYASKLCAEIQACEPGFFPFFGFADISGCRGVYAASCNDSLVAPHSGFTASVAEQCGGAYSGMDCTTFRGQGGIPVACVIRGGTVANGDPCSTPWQCASGRCSLGNLGQCGTCVPAVPLGQPCSTNDLLGSACADNLVCAVTATSGTASVCAAAVSMGGACADPAVCPEDGYCDTTTHVCTKLPALGESCAADEIYLCDPTQTGATCDSTTSTCVAITVASSGEPCGVLADSYASCSGTCDTAPDGGAGTCTPSDTDGGSCSPSEACLPNCADPAGCANLVCAGTVDAAASSAAGLEGRGFWRLRRHRSGSRGAPGGDHAIPAPRAQSNGPNH